MKAVFFDIDETLLSEKPLIMLFLPQVYTQIAKKLGISKDKARELFLNEIMGRKETYEWHDWNFFFKLFNLDLNYEDLLRTYPHKLEVFPDSKPALEWLKDNGYILGVITSGPEYQRLKLRLTKLDKYFDVVITREDVNAIKPEPKIFFHALEEAGVEPRDAVMVGDSLQQDVFGAKNVGMTGIWINRRSEDDYYFADYKIRSLYELMTILRREERDESHI
ncbi:TIGR02253 family HAD-type hydrolase [Palaeococcus sp. (in: euryarchaeotes)]